MKKSTSITFLLLFYGSMMYSQTSPQKKQKDQKPAYTGIVEYTKGNFGTYNYPVKGDSIFIYIGNNDQISFKILPAKGDPRSLELSSENLQLVKKQMYENIISPDKVIPTGNFDLKFSTAKNSHIDYTVSLAHYGNGDTAELTVIGEHDGLRIDDLFTAQLIKSK